MLKMLQQQRNAAGILDECCRWRNAAGLLPNAAGPLGQGRWNQDPLKPIPLSSCYKGKSIIDNVEFINIVNSQPIM